VKPYLTRNQEIAIVALLATALLICGIILFPLPRTPLLPQPILLVGAEIITPLFIVPQPPLVNINTASVDELITLPGIGPTLAARIIAFRTEFGPFNSVEDLLRVRGIRSKLLEKIRDRITLTD
jgi:competence ComEA-like helix-hairpin-helix protein